MDDLAFNGQRVNGTNGDRIYELDTDADSSMTPDESLEQCRKSEFSNVTISNHPF